MSKHFLELKVGDKVICIDEYSGGTSYHTLVIDSIEDDKEYATESNPLGRRYFGTDQDYLNEYGDFEEGDNEYLTIVDEANYVSVVEKENTIKYRVWWIPQVGVNAEPFYIPVGSVEESKKVMDMLAAYDAYQLQHNIKPDYSNVGGLQIFDEEEQDWVDWYIDTEEAYYDDVDEYCEQCDFAEELEQFNKEVFNQIDWDLINKFNG